MEVEWPNLWGKSMVPGSYLFSSPGEWPFWLPVRLNLCIFGSEKDNNQHLLSWKCNGRIYVSRAWFHGHTSLCFQDNGHQILVGCPFGPMRAFWNLNEITLMNVLYRFKYKSQSLNLITWPWIIYHRSR